jgi:hypothetical protein
MTPSIKRNVILILPRRESKHFRRHFRRGMINEAVRQTGQAALKHFASGKCLLNFPHG